MRLRSFRIENYRSVVHSGTISVTDIMVLVGPNQSGKTSILKGLNSISLQYKYDQQNELTQLNGINKKYTDGDLKPQDLPIVTATFLLEEEDKGNLREKFIPVSELSDQPSAPSTAEGSQATEGAGQPDQDSVILPKVLESINEIEVTKFIDGSYSVNLGGRVIVFTNPLLQINKIRDLIIQIHKESQSEFTRDPNRGHKSTFDNLYTDFLRSETHELLPKSSFTEPLSKFISGAPVDGPLKEKLSNGLVQLEQALGDYPPTKSTREMASFLLERMPRTVYFKDYERLEDSITISELQQNPSAHRTFFNLLELAEIRIPTIEKLRTDNPTAVQQYLESASGTVTTKLRHIWKQESFNLSFRFEGGRIMVFTTDPQEPGTLLPPSYGSEGFQWYLGFYIHFAVATKTEYKNAILLLDDPGVYLHPEGHKDLLQRLNEYLTDDVRTIYSTHLPSLIPKDSIRNVRVVEKRNGKTTVTENFWKLDNKDAWAPIRAALGIEISDSLLVGNQTIMVEGPSDAIYLHSFSNILRRQGKEANLNGFVLPLNGVNNAEYFTRLFDSQKFPYVLVTDTRSTESLNLPDPTRLIQVSLKNRTRSDQKEFDIEDMVENDLLVKALSFTHPELDLKQITERLNSSGKKAVTIIREQFKGTNRDVDKIALARNVEKLAKESTEAYKKTLDNFEALFQQIESKFKA